MAALNIPIQMFGACSTLGDMTPLWFRYENKDHGIITVKIESIVSSREEKFCGMEHISFVCWAVAEGQRRLIELRYRSLLKAPKLTSIPLTPRLPCM